MGSPVALKRADGIRVAIKLTPKAARDRIDGVARTVDGEAFLKVSVTTVPEDGKANAALIGLLSKVWRVPRSAMAIIRGATDRHKVLHITGQGDDFLAWLDEWIAKQS